MKKGWIIVLITIMYSNVIQGNEYLQKIINNGSEQEKRAMIITSSRDDKSTNMSALLSSLKDPLDAETCQIVVANVDNKPLLTLILADYFVRKQRENHLLNETNLLCISLQAVQYGTLSVLKAMLRKEPLLRIHIAKLIDMDNKDNIQYRPYLDNVSALCRV